MFLVAVAGSAVLSLCCFSSEEILRNNSELLSPPTQKQGIFRLIDFEIETWVPYHKVAAEMYDDLRSTGLNSVLKTDFL